MGGWYHCFCSGKQAKLALDLENKPISAGDETSQTALAGSLSYHLASGVDTVTVPYFQEETRTDLIYHHGYDPLMLRINAITLNRGENDVVLNLGYEYAANGNITTIGYDGGLSTETYCYDKLNRLTSVDYGGGAGIVYTYNVTEPGTIAFRKKENKQIVTEPGTISFKGAARSRS